MARPTASTRRGLHDVAGAVCANVEVNEAYLPILYTARRELTDPAGPGRGSTRRCRRCRVARRTRATGPLGVVSFGQGLLHPCAPGIGGGEAGGGSLFALASDAVAAAAVLAGTSGAPAGIWPAGEMHFDAGTTQLVATQGGGGWRPDRARAGARRRRRRSRPRLPHGALADYAVVLTDAAPTRAQRGCGGDGAMPASAAAGAARRT